MLLHKVYVYYKVIRSRVYKYLINRCNDRYKVVRNPQNVIIL